jgi:transcriptional regulator with PAS, ATPase and Fis domain
MIIGKSKKIKRVKEIAGKVAETSFPVLLLGASGTGKELFARFIHEKSPRAGHLLNVINCSALADHLLDSELFGHSRGAFTGANERRRGLLEATHEGTLFLDEIADLSLSAQAKVLRVLEYGDFKRVGEDRMSHADVRIIAATNKDLGKEMAEGRFREDLYYRLSRFVIEIPRLTERPEDIVDIATFYLKDTNPQHRFTGSAMKKMRAYDWPGNVRELMNVVIQASVLLPSSRKTIQAQDLPFHVPVEKCHGTKIPSFSIEDKKKLVMDLFAQTAKIKNADVRSILQVSHTTATKILNMLEGNCIVAHKNGKGTYYTRMENPE